MNKQTYLSVKEIVDYLWRDEERHYEECKKQDRKGHIFNDIRRVSAWLTKVAKKYEE